MTKMEVKERVDIFKHPMVGSLLKQFDGGPRLYADMICHAWDDEQGACFYWPESKLYYTNCHATWRQMYGKHYKELENKAKRLTNG